MRFEKIRASLNACTTNLDSSYFHWLDTHIYIYMYIYESAATSVIFNSALANVPLWRDKPPRRPITGMCTHMSLDKLINLIADG